MDRMSGWDETLIFRKSLPACTDPVILFCFSGFRRHSALNAVDTGTVIFMLFLHEFGSYTKSGLVRIYF
jgi:hypothetical protein